MGHSFSFIITVITQRDCVRWKHYFSYYLIRTLHDKSNRSCQLMLDSIKCTVLSNGYHHQFSVSYLSLEEHSSLHDDKHIFIVMFTDLKSLGTTCDSIIYHFRAFGIHDFSMRLSITSRQCKLINRGWHSAHCNSFHICAPYTVTNLNGYR